MDSALMIGGAALLLVAIGSWWALDARVTRIERKLNALLRHHGIDPTEGLPLSDRVKRLADNPDRWVEAVEAYREETGAGQEEATEAVEMYMHSK